MKKLIQITTVFLASFPLLKVNHFNIYLGIWLLIVIVYTIRNKSYRLFSLKDFIGYAPLAFYFIVHLIYLPFADDYAKMGQLLLKSSYFLIIPLGFWFVKKELTKKYFKQSMLIFLIAIGFQNIKGWLMVFYNGFNQTYNSNDFYNPTFRTIFSEATHTHLPYLGMLSSFGILLCLNNLFKKSKISLKIVNLLFILIGLCSLYFYSARMALLACVIGSIYLFWKKIKSKKIKLLSMVLIPLITGLVIYFSPIKERYQKSLETEWTLPYKGQLPHEVNYRYAILHCSYEVIKDNWILGTKPDQAQAKLNACYESFTYESYEDFNHKTYNSHNQFIDFFIKFGLLGFLILTGFLIWQFFKNKQITTQLFILIITLSMLTENILDRQLGIVFLVLFFSLLDIKRGYINK